MFYYIVYCFGMLKVSKFDDYFLSFTTALNVLTPITAPGWLGTVALFEEELSIYLLTF